MAATKNVKKEIKDVSDIQLLVNTFYARAKNDDLLSPIFSERFGGKASLEALYQYWQTILLGEGNYQGVPFPKHADLPLTHQHFDRWLTLFLETVTDLFEGKVAEAAKVRAIKMSEVFRYKMELNNF
jgi:hemoglobin